MSASKNDDDRLELLLADAKEQRPVLEEGLPSEAAQRGPRPKKDESFLRRRDDADPNNLKLQRWAVIAPEGRAGDKLLEAITPLIRLREEEQGAPAMVHRAPSEMTAKQAVAWKEETYWSERVTEAERPLYLLMLGDLHETQAELQHTLANGALVGRLHFADAAGEADLDGYAAYAEKAARYAREGSSFEAPEMAFFSAADGTAATQMGELKLVHPGIEDAEAARAKRQLPLAGVRRIEAETVDELLAGGAGETPSVLLSVTHGAGPPRRGFRSEEEQQRKQGALVLGPGEVLDAERVANQRFLPGGMWFCLACFGGGTPSASAYHAWLKQLAEEDAWSGRAESVLRALPAGHQRPFVAAMPQAALRNPEGPLGVIAHLDLAWTYGFTSAKNLSEGRRQRIMTALQTLARGSRAGIALSVLLRYYRETNDALMVSYQLEADARAYGRTYEVDKAERGHLWMLRNDLRGYVLLGDPAARLPLKQLRLAPRPDGAAGGGAAGAGPAGSVSAGSVSAGSVSAASVSAASVSAARAAALDKEEAVRAMLQGDEAPRAIAAAAGVSLETLWDWWDAHRAAARERLP